MEFVRHPAVLITGGSRGIGAATALSLSNHGYNVAITYRNKSAKANEVTTEMGQAIVRAAMNTMLPSGHTVVVGGALDTFDRRK